jgi:hypothetical protein
MSAPTTEKATQVASRVAALKTLAETDPQAAQDAVWEWFRRVGDELPSAAAEEELNVLFKTSTDASAVDGQSKGILVGWVAPKQGLDAAGKGLMHLGIGVTKKLGVLPWLGKRFDSSTQQGINSVTGVALALKPLTSVARSGHGKHFEAFPMKNWVERGKLDADTDVFVIDYDSAPGNPFPVSRIRDELVEIVPNTYLGKMLWRQGDGNQYHLLAFFALKTPVSQ